MKKFHMTKFNVCFFLLFGFIGLTLLTTAFENADEVIYDATPNLPSKHDEVNYVNTATSRTVPYFFFQDGYVYDSQGATKELFYSEQSKLISNAAQLAARKTLTSIAKFEFGNYRVVSQGLEFQLFFKGTNSTASSKISLLQRFSMSTFITVNSYSNMKDVDIILPLQGRLDALKIFLDNLVKNVLPTEPYLILTIVYFQDEKAAEAKTLFEELQNTCFLLRGSFVLVEDSKFSRGKGLRIGVEHATKLPFQLLFFCDVDVIIKPSFFKRCRAHSIQHHQVYYPIVFSLYNPKVVFGLQSQIIPPIEIQYSVDVDPNHGFWRHFGYGMACMHRSEFMAAGGLPELQTWGGEDVGLYNKIVAMGSIKPIRAPDDGLYHLFHHKICDHLKGHIYISCIRSKAANEGNQMQLGLLAIKFQEGVDIEGALYSWRYEYLKAIQFMLLVLMMIMVWMLCKRLAVLRNNANKIKRFRATMGN